MYCPGIRLLDRLPLSLLMRPACANRLEEVTIKAAAERIFSTLTNPDELLKWWAAEGRFHATHVETDPRPGGRWLMRVSSDRGTDASKTTVRGEYRTVEPPSLLVFTWIRDEETARGQLFVLI
jgi:uncharacterized protein YndB with AHSA1/START domain